MSRRLEVELTSQRDDGTWTWRAAGARQPKGVLDGSLLHEGMSTGDVVRVEAEFDLDGIVVTHVLPPRKERSGPETIELLGSGRDVPGVTHQLVPGRRRRDDDGDGGRGGRRGGGRNKGRGPRQDDRGDRGQRDERPRRERSGPRERAPRPERDSGPERPKPKRLRPGRTHRNAWVAGLPDEQKPIADQLVRGGIPAVRKALDAENQRATEEGRPTIDPGPLLALAETLLPGLRVAEWLDRADAAKAEIDDVDLRDLRSVVVAAEDGARTPEARELAEELKAGLAQRVEAEHTSWLSEVRELLAEGRIVRALRVSSRPPKAGAPFPRELADQMVEQANAALGPEVSQQRWGAVLEAVAYSPVRAAVTPASIPSNPGEELLETVRKMASRVPDIAAALGVTPTKRRRPKKKPAPTAEAAPTPPPPPPPSPGPEAAPPPDATAPEAEAAPQPEPTAPEADAAPEPEGGSEV